MEKLWNIEEKSMKYYHYYHSKCQAVYFGKIDKISETNKSGGGGGLFPHGFSVSGSFTSLVQPKRNIQNWTLRQIHMCDIDPSGLNIYIWKI